MTSSHDLPGRPACPTAPDSGPARPRRRRAATLLAAAAPLAAVLATVPAAVAFATSAPAAAHNHTHAAELLATATLPATTAGTACSPCDPKIPTMVGD
jgi:hypothetical protein